MTQKHSFFDTFTEVWNDIGKLASFLLTGTILWAIISFILKLLTPWSKVTEFLHEWENLSGAFAGAFLAMIASAIGYLYVEYRKIVSERAEALRHIEISNSYSLNSTYVMIDKLKFFIDRAENFIKEQKFESNEVLLSTFNFTPLGEIYFDPTAHSFRVKSYYLHNKLLVLHSNLSNWNLILGQLKGDFENIVRLNELIVGLVMPKKEMTPTQLRMNFLENIENFKEEIKKVNFDEIIKIMAQIRVYNGLLRMSAGAGTLNRWRYEGLPYTKKEITLLEEIDDQINSKVLIEIEKAESRRAALANKEAP